MSEIVAMKPALPFSCIDLDMRRAMWKALASEGKKRFSGEREKVRLLETLLLETLMKDLFRKVVTGS